MGQIIGYSKFKSKTGKDCCVVLNMIPCTPRDNEFGRGGNKVEEVFVPENQHSQINDKVIGHEIEVLRDFYNGRVYVNGVVIK